MHDYTVNLALFDYIPIILGALAFFTISQIIALKTPGNANLARLGVLLIVSGGLMKATWKLIVAASGEHIPWMNNLLFILMAPGFFLLTYSLAFRTRAAFPLMGAAALLGMAWVFHLLNPEQRYWFFWLLTVITVSNTVFIVLLTKQSLQLDLKLAAALFLLNYAGTLCLSGLARIPDQTAALQWVEEILNTFTQLSLLLAAIRLRRASVEQPFGEKP